MSKETRLKPLTTKDLNDLGLMCALIGTPMGIYAIITHGGWRQLPLDVQFAWYS